ncbi:hypothetical protein FOXB_17596 [Fusarium oxysporum f. sp. conglutinans Fo5176]|uniref:Uncharacterized protein n=1 Tax=Fusarium oxysporum (strain Fo5176) TaxID=660025 RepID=F9GG12_FUSOF|nr:hypothetical protein FOXB_17596 [Fusarium oxysporum f. sp. conglutinans Fo5176]
MWNMWKGFRGVDMEMLKPTWNGMEWIWIHIMDPYVDFVLSRSLPLSFAKTPGLERPWHKIVCLRQGDEHMRDHNRTPTRSTVSESSHSSQSSQISSSDCLGDGIKLQYGGKPV